MDTNEIIAENKYLHISNYMKTSEVVVIAHGHAHEGECKIYSEWTAATKEDDCAYKLKCIKLADTTHTHTHILYYYTEKTSDLKTSALGLLQTPKKHSSHILHSSARKLDTTL